MSQTKRTPELVLQVRRLRKKGKTWREIGIAMGVSETTAHEWGDDAYRNRNQSRREQDKTVLRHAVDHRVDKVDESKLPKPLPDTRDLTGRHFGDPLPERSALAMRARQ